MIPSRPLPIRRILVVGPASREWDLAAYLQAEFRAAGIDCSLFDYGQIHEDAELESRALEALAAVQPDVVLGLKLDRISPRTLRRLREAGARIVLWYVDCFSDEIPAWLVPRIAEVDLFLTTARGMLERYRELGPTPVAFVHEGVHLPAFPDEDVPEAQRALYESEVAFLGNVFQPPSAVESVALRRLRLLARVGSRFRLKVWGPQSPAFDRAPGPFPFRVIRWPAYNQECVKVCRSAGVVLGINTIDTVDLYFSNRTFLTLGSGGFHLTSYVPGLEEMFENHRHLVWYHSDEECLELVAYYLNRPTERRRISEEGKRLVRAQASMAGQIQKILEEIARHGLASHS